MFCGVTEACIGFACLFGAFWKASLCPIGAVFGSGLEFSSTEASSTGVSGGNRHPLTLERPGVDKE